MTRRFLITAAIAATTVALSGCATFTENSVVATVEGAELTEDDMLDLSAQLRQDLGLEAHEMPAQPIREYVAAFVVSEVLAAARPGRPREVPSANRYLALSALRQVAAGR